MVIVRLGSVVRVSSAALLVPPAFVAEILKWYVVLAARPVSAAETATGLSADPGSEEHAARLSVGGRGPVFKFALADFPAVGVDRAFRVAVVVWATRLRCYDYGALGSVLSVSSEPLLVPPALVAEILKW